MKWSDVADAMLRFAIARNAPARLPFGELLSYLMKNRFCSIRDM
jgi:hypothetical protein